ncbi:MAG TPA: O-antigen ligase family protein, partial [Terriglobales bacterium]|nr:O-antigen ligase family protein [Terriglobales bacterium]
MREITLHNSWNSRVWKRIDLIATLAAIILACQVAWVEDIAWMQAVAVGIIVVTVGMLAWPYGILVLLIGSSVMSVFMIEVVAWNARPEHFAVVYALIAVGVWLVAGKRKPALNRFDYCILLFVIANFFSSAFGSTDPASTLRWALQNCLAVLFYFLVRVLVQDTRTLNYAVRIFLTIALVESVYGILCYVSHQIFDTSFGMAIGQYLDTVAAPLGTLFEPNLFGAYTASASVMFFALYLFAGHRALHLVCFLISGIASFLSFSRASLAALFVVGGYLFWKSVRHTKGDILRKLLAVGLVVVLILLLLSGPLGQVIRERFTNLFYEGLAEETALGRAIIFQEAIQEVPGHLLIGRGTASFNLTFDWNKYIPSWASEKTWIGNAPLRILHDTGLLGLASIFGFFVTVWLKIRPALRAPAYKNCLVV